MIQRPGTEIRIGRHGCAPAVFVGVVQVSLDAD
jgi:hypothetical protein